MTAFEYITKLNKKSISALESAEKRNVPDVDIANIEEKIKCQTEIMELLMKEEHDESEHKC